MSYVTSKAVKSTTWKAAGFLNLILASPDGVKRPKLGALPLRDKYVHEKSLREYCEANPGNVAGLVSKLIVEYNAAGTGEDGVFDFAPATVVEDGEEDNLVKADGFLNFYILTTDGTKAKVGAIGLHDSDTKKEGPLRAGLEADPVKFLKIITDRLEVNYKSATPTAALAL